MKVSMVTVAQVNMIIFYWCFHLVDFLVLLNKAHLNYSQYKFDKYCKNMSKKITYFKTFFHFFTCCTKGYCNKVIFLIFLLFPLQKNVLVSTVPLKYGFYHFYFHITYYLISSVQQYYQMQSSRHLWWWWKLYMWQWILRPQLLK